MSTITKVKTVLVTLKTRDAEDWINDNISIPARQWQKNDDTGNLEFQIDSTFADELLDEMTEDLQPNIDFAINEA